MSSDAPRRTLGGLAPKVAPPQGNSRLMRKNRTTGASNSVPAPEVGQQRAHQPASIETPIQPPVTSSPSRRKVKLGFYIDAEDAARLRGAAKFIPNELRADGIDGFSALAAKLIMDGLAELERAHNNGEPWPSLAPGEELPRGRRVQ